MGDENYLYGSFHYMRSPLSSARLTRPTLCLEATANCEFTAKGDHKVTKRKRLYLFQASNPSAADCAAGGSTNTKFGFEFLAFEYRFEPVKALPGAVEVLLSTNPQFSQP